MTVAAIGKLVPDVELPATSDKTVKFSDYRGKTVVLFFYPNRKLCGNYPPQRHRVTEVIACIFKPQCPL